MLVLEDDGGRAAALAGDLQERLEALGAYRREARKWLPHLTVARFRKPRGLAPPLPNRGTYVLIPSDASAYLSRLRPSGAQYEILDSVAVGTSWEVSTSG
jgi:2'-5' RNA ligase